LCVDGKLVCSSTDGKMTIPEDTSNAIPEMVSCFRRYRPVLGLMTARPVDLFVTFKDVYVSTDVPIVLWQGNIVSHGQGTSVFRYSC
jgi:hypothetical protein